MQHTQRRSPTPGPDTPALATAGPEGPHRPDLWGPRSFARSRWVALTLLASAQLFLMLAATGLLVGGYFTGSFALQRADGYSALHVGLAFLPIAVATVCGGPVERGRSRPRRCPATALVPAVLRRK